MSIFSFFLRKKNNETAKDRRERLLSKGRLTDEIIVESLENAEGDAIVQYSYDVHGAALVSCDVLTEGQKRNPVT